MFRINQSLPADYRTNQRRYNTSRWLPECLETRNMLATITQYSEKLQADDAYQIEWCTDGDSVRFRLTATATGWVGVGFNDRQRMASSDVVMATGEGAIQDAFADVTGVPSVDAKQSVTLISSSQTEAGTTVEFSRKITTDDSNDDYALNVPRFVVWAYNLTRDGFNREHSERGFSATKLNLSTAAACRFVSTDLPKLSVANGSKLEGNTASEVWEFPVTMSAASTNEVTVHYTVSAGTATADSDFVPISGTLTFAPNGSLSQSIPISIVGDEITEADETVTITLSEPTGATIEVGQATGTITNDDLPPEITVGNVEVAEGDADAPQTISVSLSHASSLPVTVHYALQADTAVAVSDYIDTTGDLTIEAGATSTSFTLTIVGDTAAESTETLKVVLSSPTNATLVAGQESAVVTITDNDVALPAHPWQNTQLAEDTDGSGSISPIDALLVINRLNEIGPGELPVPPVAPDVPPPYFDVNGDDFVSPIDALLVINWLNDHATEAAAAVMNPLAATSATPSDIDIALALISIDDDHENNAVDE